MTGIARLGDRVEGVDTHIVGGNASAFNFSGTLRLDLVDSVTVNGLAVAVSGSIAINNPPHPPAVVATNQGRVLAARSVMVDGKPVACLNDIVFSCNDPVDLPTSSITSASSDVTVG
jgi:uncharacterized Zn-binding protein involved in type VI secretion